MGRLGRARVRKQNFKSNGVLNVIADSPHGVNDDLVAPWGVTTWDDRTMGGKV